jgi:hypothetical protein
MALCLNLSLLWEHHKIHHHPGFMYASSASVTRAEFQGFYKESEVDPAPAL